MKTSVPRLTIIDGRKFLPDGRRACSVGICARPAVVTPKRVQSYCREHATEAVREWRRGKIATMLTAEERELIRELREVKPAGRHHAGLSVDHEARRIRWMAWNWSFNLALLGAVMLTGAWGFR